MSNPKLAALPIALAAIAMFSGCQTSPTRGGSSDSDIVKKRAEQRWAYLIEKKVEKAYPYLTPGYRKTKELQQYIAEKTSIVFNWKRATSTNAECEEDVCTVFISLDYEVTLPNTGGKPIDTFAPLREKWVKVGTQWYFLPDK